MKNHQFNLIVVLGLLLTFALACNFKFGETSDNSNKVVSRKENSTDKPKKKSDKKGNSKTSSDSETESPKKIGGYTYQRFDYSVYQIPKNISEDELTKIAQALHEREPKSFLVLADDESKAEQYVIYHEQADKGTPEVEFPLDWANEHIVASVVMFLEGERKWYLTKGYGYEKITELE